MKILGLVAARGGSKGVPGKNIRPLLGKPLIAYSIETLKKWGRVDRLVVSTDSPEIASVARDFGAQVPFLRPAELATDTAEKMAVLRHALKASEKIFKEKYSLVVDLDACAPLRKVQDLNNCLKLFLERRPQSLFSVVRAHKNPYFNMVEVGEGGWAELCKTMSTGITRRQEAPAVYSMNASIYFYDRDFLADEATTSCISDRSIVYEMEEVTGSDIDREVDFGFAEFVLSKGLYSLE